MQWFNKYTEGFGNVIRIKNEMVRKGKKSRKECTNNKGGEYWKRYLSFSEQVMMMQKLNRMVECDTTLVKWIDRIKECIKELQGEGAEAEQEKEKREK